MGDPALNVVLEHNHRTTTSRGSRRTTETASRGERRVQLAWRAWRGEIVELSTDLGQRVCERTVTTWSPPRPKVREFSCPAHCAVFWLRHSGGRRTGTTAMTTIHADDLRPGDTVVWDGATTRSPASTGETAGPGPSPSTELDGPSPWTTTLSRSTARRLDQPEAASDLGGILDNRWRDFRPERRWQGSRPDQTTAQSGDHGRDGTTVVPAAARAHGPNVITSCGGLSGAFSLLCNCCWKPARPRWRHGRGTRGCHWSTSPGRPRSRTTPANRYLTAWSPPPRSWPAGSPTSPRLRSMVRRCAAPAACGRRPPLRRTAGVGRR